MHINSEDGMRRHTLYIYSLWIATCTMLLSTVVLHHHHLERICFVEERCPDDGNINDEHTEHHENEQEGCRVHQMHRFLINAKAVKSIYKKLLDGGNLFLTIIPSCYELMPVCGLVVTKWQERVSPLASRDGMHYDRRGPPTRS